MPSWLEIVFVFVLNIVAWLAICGVIYLAALAHMRYRERKQARRYQRWRS